MAFKQIRLACDYQSDLPNLSTTALDSQAGLVFMKSPLRCLDISCESSQLTEPPRALLRHRQVAMPTPSLRSVQPPLLFSLDFKLVCRVSRDLDMRLLFIRKDAGFVFRSLRNNSAEAILPATTP